MSTKTPGDTTVREKIEQRMKDVEEQHKRDQLKRRLEVARAGATLYQNKNMPEALKMFHSYLHILEDWKGVPRGGLGPHLFDAKKDLGELVLISGVYWDMVKLYDRTKNRHAEFKGYLDKYLLFSKGYTYQPLAAEALRKYIANGKAIHRSEFKSAYQSLTGEKCFIATSLMDVCEFETLTRLREFRDQKLIKKSAGQLFVMMYYRHGEKLAKGVNRMPEFARKFLGRALDFISKRLSSR